MCIRDSLLTKELRAQGGIVVTASHNPREWNGLKFLSARGLYLDAGEVEEFLDIYHQGEFAFVRSDKHRVLLAEDRPTRHHLGRLLKALDVETIRRAKIRVAADCANGAGAMLMPEFLEALGCEATWINATPDGTFAHQSEPVPENLGELCRSVREAGADVGFAQDADADRLAIVDEKGEPLGEELTLALAAEFVLGRTKGPIVTNVSTSRAIDDIGRKHGVAVIRAKTGEINVVERLLGLPEPAAIGGEGNGGVILPAVHPCRDSFAAMGLILELMASTGRPLSDLRRDVPAYVLLKDKIPGTREQAARLIRGLRRKYEGRASVSLLDGLKVEWPNRWVLVRPSNTEPIIRLNVEARTRAEAEAALAALKEDLEGEA